jgi:anti-anti-sigma factor
MPGLQLTSNREGPVARIAVAGELDIASCWQLEEKLKRLEADGPELLVIDLRETVFIDSSGLRTLIAADSRARERGGKLQIVRGPKAVERVLGATGLDERLEIVDSPPA